MRAMVTPRFGGVELFEEKHVERPRPDPGEVLVRGVVAGTNPVDTKLRADGSFAEREASDRHMPAGDGEHRTTLQRLLS